MQLGRRMPQLGAATSAPLTSPRPHQTILLAMPIPLAARKTRRIRLTTSQTPKQPLQPVVQMLTAARKTRLATSLTLRHKAQPAMSILTAPWQTIADRLLTQDSRSSMQTRQTMLVACRVNPIRHQLPVQATVRIATATKEAHTVTHQLQTVFSQVAKQVAKAPCLQPAVPLQVQATQPSLQSAAAIWRPQLTVHPAVALSMLKARALGMMSRPLLPRQLVPTMQERIIKDQILVRMT